jgi:hypothetical protein
MNPPASAKEVNRNEFFKVIGPLNVYPSPIGDWPYLSVFKTPSGQVMGWSKFGDKGEPNRYYLP